MDDVAHHLGISKKTLYQYFRNKEELVSRVMQMDHERNLEFHSGIENKNMNAIEELMEVYRMINRMLREYNPSIEYDVRKYYPSLFMKFRETRRKDMYQSTYRNLKKGIKEGFYRKDLDPDLISRFQVSRIEHLFDNDIFTINEQLTVKFFHELFMYHINGILNKEGREFFEKNFEKYRSGMT
jgi:AcrR family transcriptional regulator